MCKEGIRLGRETASNVKQITGVLNTPVKALGTRRDRIALFVTIDATMFAANAVALVGNVAKAGSDGFAMCGGFPSSPLMTVEWFGELVTGEIWITCFTGAGTVTVTEIYLTKPIAEVGVE